jgi:CRISPR/Cas system-associated endonuclease/helicase Cas3
MEEFRTHWLPRNWVEDVHTQMLGSRLDPKQATFENWATEVQTLNIALHGTNSHIDDDAIRCQLEANINHDLHTRARHEKASKIEEFLPWLECMSELDEEHQSDHKHIAEVVEEMCPNKCPFNPARSVNLN